MFSVVSDFIQLYNACTNVSLYNPIKKKFVPHPGFDYVTWKSLKGDGSDNISGFYGIGDKRALALADDKNILNEFLDRDQNRELFERNYRLIKFFDLSEEMHKLERSIPTADWPTIRKQFIEFEFFSMTNDKSWEKYVRTFQNL